jgi:hypothetical protein
MHRQSGWYHSWNQFFSAFRTSKARKRSTAVHPRRMRRFEALEERTVLSANFASALSIGGAGQDGVYDIEADAAGYSYVTGEFSGTVDFDLGQTHAGDADILSARGSRDAFVAKYTPDDSLVWVQRMGGDAVQSNYSDIGRSIALDTIGNVYVAGEFYATADFGSTTLTAAAGADAFVAKFDASGSFAWVKQVANASFSRGVDVDAQGNVYAMTLRDATGFDVMKFTASGATAWTKSLVTKSSYSGDLAVSASGNAYLVGSFSNTVDFDPGPKVTSVSVGGRNAAFVLKLDTNGKFGWVSPFSGAGQAYAYSVAVDGGNNVIVGGSYSGTVDFNPAQATTTLASVGGGFVAKLNSSGGLVWAKAMANAGSESGPAVFGLDTDSAGNVYATGVFYGAIDLDPSAGVITRSSAGGTDIFVVKLTSAGNYAWSETFGSAELDTAWAVAVDNSGFVHLAGYFYDEIDVDPDPLGVHLLDAPGNGRNGFRLRLQQT